MSKGYSGKSVDQVTVESIRRGEISRDDVRIHPETLESQAKVAEKQGNPQLALNFRRAAELTQLSEQEIMGLYEALRPHRSSIEELNEIAEGLQKKGAGLNAKLFIEAADIYQRRGLLKK